jgi:hypothetical protein
MAAEQIAPIPCEGRLVDPELMTVIEVVEAEGTSPGTVTKELRRGYTWRGRVLRYAEVQAARGGLSLPEASDRQSVNGPENTRSVSGVTPLPPPG